jgi:hypothetical protein
MPLRGHVATPIGVHTVNQKITFSRPEVWNDRLGKHSCAKVRKGGVEVGTICGESGVAIPVMHYTIELNGMKPFGAPSFKEAKARAIAKLREPKKCICNWDRADTRLHHLDCPMNPNYKA